MSETLRMWIEIIFNLIYLCFVWGYVAAMISRRSSVALSDRPVANRFSWAFALLAFGDSGHVGFRVIAYALGDLNAKVYLFGKPLSLVGAGALMTAITVTFFYVLILDIWRLRFNKPLGWFGWFLLLAAMIRLLLLIPAANHWEMITPPQPWSLIRNLPLLIQGVGVMVLILRDGYSAKDRTFIAIGWLIFLSYLCYTPVILFVQIYPLIGMLMIPKTLAYLAIAVVAYQKLFRLNKTKDFVTNPLAG
ncbi:MAG: hypothetical protein ACPL6F_04405 [Anaerolineales bacterium]